MANERQSKRGHPVRNTGIAAVLLALLLGGGRYGFGIGRGGEGFLTQTGNSTKPETASQTTQSQPAAKPETQETAPETTPEAPSEETDDGVLEILVREDRIYYEGEELDLAGLEEALLRDYGEGKRVTLTDDHAIKAAFDEVSALLGRLEIPTE